MFHVSMCLQMCKNVFTKGTHFRGRLVANHFTWLAQLYNCRAVVCGPSGQKIDPPVMNGYSDNHYYIVHQHWHATTIESTATGEQSGISVGFGVPQGYPVIASSSQLSFLISQERTRNWLRLNIRGQRQLCQLSPAQEEAQEVDFGKLWFIMAIGVEFFFFFFFFRPFLYVFDRFWTLSNHVFFWCFCLSVLFLKLQNCFVDLIPYLWLKGLGIEWMMFNLYQVTIKHIIEQPHLFDAK